MKVILSCMYSFRRTSLCREEFVSSMKIMFTAWVSTQKALESYGGISGAISIMANIIYGLLVAIIVLGE